MRKRKFGFPWILYACIIASCAIGGYFGFSRGPLVTKIYFAREPSTPPDRDFPFYNTLEESDRRLVTSNVSRIRERNPEHPQNDLTAYWSPNAPGVWGSVEMEWSWEEGFFPQLAILHPSLHLFPVFDPSVSGEIAVSSQATGDRWVTLASIESRNGSIALVDGIDVTPWVQNSHALRVRYRLRASKLIYHPTPNDPIGLAGAQCLRTNGDTPSSRLRLWAMRPENY
jgi:hypothetical protein